MTVFYRNAPHFQFGLIQKHGPNVLSFQVAPGGRRWLISGCYLAPYDAVTTERVIVSIGYRPRGAVLLVSGDFNTNIVAPEGINRREEIVAFVATSGLEDMSIHFLLLFKSWVWDRRTCSMCRLGR